MECPRCQNPNSRVLESRSTENGQSIRRRRECLNCKHRFTTYERIELVPITVIKKDGKRESFDSAKLLRGLIRACEKTGIPHSRLQNIVEEIESILQHCALKEITSERIGKLVLKSLREENEVAYIRFASVYGNFKGIKDFLEALETLQEETPNEWDVDCLSPDESPEELVELA